MGLLEGAGLARYDWDAADARACATFVASSADACGRGMELHVVDGGEAVDMTGATAVLLWRHRVSGARGSAAFEEVDASSGVFRVFWPADLACCEGPCDAQVMVACGDGEFLSSLVFEVRAEPVLTGGVEGVGSLTIVQQAAEAYAQAVAALEEASAAAVGIDEVAVVTLDAGSDATAELSDGVLTLGIPRGEQGEQGEAGADGEDGYTPVRGTDYWTDEDVATIEAYVDARYEELLEEVENGTY